MNKITYERTRKKHRRKKNHLIDVISLLISNVTMMNNTYSFTLYIKKN